MKRYSAHANINWNFFKNNQEKNPLFFGIELEIANNGQDVDQERIVKIFNNYLENSVDLTTDMSVENGWELLFHPMTLGFINRNKKRLEKTFSFLRFLNYTTCCRYTSCGMHINIDKQIFTTNELERLKKTFVSNIGFFFDLSKRDIENFDEYCFIDPGLCFWDRDHSGFLGAFSIRQKKIEFRFFSATLDSDVYIKRIQFIKELVKFVKTKENPNNFKSWMNKTKSRKKLTKFLLDVNPDNENKIPMNIF